MFDSIVEMHQKVKHIHRDIKPENFRVTKDGPTVYAIDFGLTIPYIDDQGNHIKEQKDYPLLGTYRYTSCSTHEGITQSRRDDLEMIGYSILKLLGPDPNADLWP